MSDSRRGGKDRGANLVEFALLMPFVLLLLLGAVEFAWLFSQNLDVRHGAREGARLVAVNYPNGPVTPTPSPTSTAQTDAIVAEVCNRMDVSSGANVTLTSDTGQVGDSATATVSAPANTLTGFLDWAIPSSLQLSSTVEIRIEQPAGWDIDGGPVPCP
jgi:Flp pilus assembly protein TadG